MLPVISSVVNPTTRPWPKKTVLSIITALVGYMTSISTYTCTLPMRKYYKELTCMSAAKEHQTK